MNPYITNATRDAAVRDPWNETNPEWWREQVQWRGDLAWEWLVNEWAALTATPAKAIEAEEPCCEEGGVHAWVRHGIRNRYARPANETTGEPPLTIDEKRAAWQVVADRPGAVGDFARKRLRETAPSTAADDGLREAIRAALNELGVPGEGYPAPVANAVDILSTALASQPRNEAGLREVTERLEDAVMALPNFRTTTVRNGRGSADLPSCALSPPRAEGQPGKEPRMDRLRLLSDIRDRDAQTELMPASRSPLGRRGTVYDHARQQHSDYHLDSDEIAMGDRHMLLVWLREVPRSILDGILAQPNDPADWPEYVEPNAVTEAAGEGAEK